MNNSSQYRKDYLRGWLTSERVGSLEQADADGRTSNDAWMDGYEDQAAGREKFHRMHCPSHPACEEG